MRIAVIGVGGIGSTFAFQMVRTGRHDVTVIARTHSTRLQQLQRDEGIIDTKGEHAAVNVMDRLDESVPYDLVIVTVLAHQVDAVLAALQRSAAKRIQFMFNMFEPERLRDAVGAERCSFGMPFIQATIGNDGKLKKTIGAGGQKSKMDRQECVGVFVAAGLPAVLEPDMPLWLRCHVPMCVAFESASIAAVRRGGGASWGESMRVARGAKACFGLIERLGYRLYPAGKARLGASPAWLVALLLWSLTRVRSFRELLATGVGECRALTDVLIANAVRADLPLLETAKIEAMKPQDA